MIQNKVFYEISKSANDIVSKVHGMVELSNKMTTDAMKVDTSIDQIAMAVKRKFFKYANDSWFI